MCTHLLLANLQNPKFSQGEGAMLHACAAVRAMAGTDLCYSCVLGFEIEKKIPSGTDSKCVQNRNFDSRYFAVSRAHPDDLEFNTSYRESALSTATPYQLPKFSFLPV